MFGAASMVGSHFIEIAANRCAAAGITDPRATGLKVDRFDPIDLRDAARTRELTARSPETTIVNFAAMTDVDAVEQERPVESTAPSGSAWSVNALAAGAIAEGARSSGKYLVHVSTDFVFDGSEGPYDESAPRAPFSERLSWYGWTKSEGERRVVAADPTAAVLRISYPFRASFPGKVDFARRIVRSYRGGTLPPLYVDQQISPTWVPDVSAALAGLLARRPAGVVHVASPGLTSPYEFATELIGRIESRPVTLARGSLAGSPRDPRRAPRPRLGGLSTGRAASLGFPLTSWREGIESLVRAEEGFR